MTIPESSSPPESPLWGSSLKLVIGLTFVAIVAMAVIRLQTLIVPLILAAMLTYLLHPLADALTKATKMSWRMSVNLIFILLIIVVASLFTVTGFAVVQQVQSLVRVIEGLFNNLPGAISELSTQVYILGPISVDMSQYLSADNLTTLAEQILSAVQPLLGQAGSLVGSVASGTASTVGWGLFVLLTAYFLLIEMSQVPNQFLKLDIPGFGADIQRLVRELGKIWNAFLRGQVILFTLSLLIFSMVLSAFGMRYFYALALLAGLARFIPYVGAWIMWITTLLVAYFQPANYLGLESWQYALLVIIFVVIIDNIFDNIISPRLLGQTLGVHPAAVLVAAIIAANLLGLIGVVLAAPVLASLLLIGRYTARKMLDLAPWPEPELVIEEGEYPWAKWGGSVKSVSERVRVWLSRRFKK